MAGNQSASTLALLGLLATLGYQNRDKIGAVLNSLTGGGTGAAGGAPAGSASPDLGGMLGNILGGQGGGTQGSASPDLGGMLGNILGGQSGSGAGGLGNLLSGLSGNGGGNVLSGGLGDILKSFTDSGHGDVANSWVDPSVPTQAPTPTQVKQALGESTMTELAKQTGLGADELANRLSTAIPQTVDKLTPGGRIPNEREAHANLQS